MFSLVNREKQSRAFTRKCLTDIICQIIFEILFISKVPFRSKRKSKEKSRIFTSNNINNSFLYRTTGSSIHAVKNRKSPTKLMTEDIVLRQRQPLMKPIKVQILLIKRGFQQQPEQPVQPDQQLRQQQQQQHIGNIQNLLGLDCQFYRPRLKSKQLTKANLSVKGQVKFNSRQPERFPVTFTTWATRLFRATTFMHFKTTMPCIYHPKSQVPFPFRIPFV